jgi:hypothetical protein
MDLAVDLITEIDSDAILATDGSIEGLFTSLSTRPGRPSVFLRDEFSGLLEAMTKKDYYAGMAETFTKLYDGKFQKRILRKETIEVREPCLILFAGGIRSRILGQLTYEHVASGFLPRFVFITAESDITRLRPLGPPTEASTGRRDFIRTQLAAAASYYSAPQIMHIDGKELVGTNTHNAELTPDAWVRYNKFEQDMLRPALGGANEETLTPVFARLSISGLKAAVLLAASRRHTDKVVVGEEDLIKAFSYVEAWREHALEIVSNIGQTTQERTISRVQEMILRKPGIFKSEIMQSMHLTSREMTLIMDTLEQRNQITAQKSGRSHRLYPNT